MADESCCRVRSERIGSSRLVSARQHAVIIVKFGVGRFIQSLRYLSVSLQSNSCSAAAATQIPAASAPVSFNFSNARTQRGRKPESVHSENVHCAAHIHPHHTERLICKPVKSILNITNR